MATIVPSIEQCKKSKQPPTKGELFLLEYLEEHFDDEAVVYYQPCINGMRPDIVIIKEDIGLIIIEVKDWELESYTIDENNKWHLASKYSVRLKSPFEQVFSYKKDFFDIKSNVLFEVSIKNKDFYNTISTFVYFHNSNQRDIKNIYSSIDKITRESINNENLNYRNMTQEERERESYKYNNKMDYLYRKKYQYERDTSLSITRETLRKIRFNNNYKKIFSKTIYDEFNRLLNPPYHYENEGKEINYTKKQERLVISQENSRMKIRGVAGSGKTTVLAKRAVNAHKRHGGNVLILTFNLTLISFIKGKINEVRDGFSWDAFEIKNYHLFFREKLNECGLEDVDHTKDFENAEEYYYSNVKIFSDVEIKRKYKTILIDEIQDYKQDWVRIVRDCFLEENGEMVLFGDEKQNIYERELDPERYTRVINGFGRWEILTKTFRYATDSPVLDLSRKFQQSFLLKNYVQDEDETQYQPSLGGIDLSGVFLYSENSPIDFVSFLYKIARKYSIHPNDITVLGSKIKLLQEIDYNLRVNDFHKEKTITTFPSQEFVNRPGYSKEMRKIERAKKIGFNLNSGVMKISTTHSFKGFESPHVFLFVDEKDTPEVVYTGITRAKESIIIVMHSSDNPYYNFFIDHLSLLQ